MARPESAAPFDGARAALADLVQRYAVVAIVTGRRSEEAAGLLDVAGVRYEGLYGISEASADLVLALVSRVEQAARVEPAAWVEDKVASIAVHYRQATDPARAHALLVGALEGIAAGAGMVLLEGKMVLELVPADRPMKGGAVERVAGEHRLRHVLFAGDDRADIDAFDALDRLEARGLGTVRIAVRGEGTPPELIAAADVVVDGPGGLIELLRSL